MITIQIMKKIFLSIIILWGITTTIFTSCLIHEEDAVSETENIREIPEKYTIDSRHDFQGTIATWHNFSQAAGSITFDDGTFDQYSAAFPILEQLHLKATFYLAARLLDEGSWDDHGTLRKMMNWNQAAEIALAGHEIGSHTYNHVDLTTGEADVDFELRYSREYIESKIPGLKVETFCWPHWRETEETMAIAAKYYISARSGNGIISYYFNRKGGIPSDPPANMYQINALGFLNSHKDGEWQHVIDQVYESGSWFVSSYHGIDSGDLPENSLGWSALSAEKFTETLKYMQKKGFWMDTFSNVTKYIYERDNAILHIKNRGKTIEISLDDQLEDDVFNKELTIGITKPENWASIEIFDGEEKAYSFSEKNNQIFMNIIPDGKTIEIHPLLTEEE